ncbi:accessory Sec system translocase SecA2 [Spelaeicoccus albus]|uniref:Protein translocase subunit SecA n=1 Tax=Spelaeicoccus albus TaxID=1280376 RepID=A0A7Z0IID1_9MICO|nr:accessory Sec system translocase SecA2 [Spelaeicoccus albus]NYI68403.1 preprotein translocase subunit SecA [Spelaeicoccus albus]
MAVGTLFSRLLNRPGAAASSSFRWAHAALKQIGDAEKELKKLSDDELRDAAGDVYGDGEPTRAQHIEFVGIAREAGRRALDERAFDTQILGTLGLLSGHVVEMATGEGKTLAGAMAAAGWALAGRSVHVLSVNDYLAGRDREWMLPLHEMLGVATDSIDQNTPADDRQRAYAAPICYAAVNEVGFDLLRDRFIERDADQRIEEFDVVLVDEADSILIDEARVPLVLAGSTNTEAFDAELPRIIAELDPDVHYEVSPDNRAVSLTGAGLDAVEERLGGIDLYGDDSDRLSAVNIALYAHALVHRDVDYLVVDGQIRLVSDSRGRVAQLQRWPDGLQAAVEAKEEVSATASGEILDSITVEELINSYRSICGMTGTAVAVGEDLREFYGLEIAVIDPNVPCVRDDEEDRIYATTAAKDKALISEVRKHHRLGRPVLIGTRSVADSERLAEQLTSRRIDVEVLNAKDDKREAEIIAKAGAKSAVTVSTQMAGRGTDIRLGGDEVVDLGGLVVIGAGRYHSSRLDDQLRGRSGRQGDPGSSVFFTSLDDDLFRRVPEASRLADAADESGRVTHRRAAPLLEHAQRILEGENTAIHRDTWRFNQLVQKQRSLVLDKREGIRHDGVGQSEVIEGARDSIVDDAIEEFGEAAVHAGLRDALLFHLDERWVEHLEFLNDLREGIHLRSLAREKPHEAFNIESIKAFETFWPDVLSSTIDTVNNAEFNENGIDLVGHGMRRPSSTWTYLTTESVSSSDIESFVRRLGKKG